MKYLKTLKERLTFKASALRVSSICIGPSDVERNKQFMVERGVRDVNFTGRHADNGACS